MEWSAFRCLLLLLRTVRWVFKKSLLEILVKKCRTGFSKKTKSLETLKKCPSDLWNCFQMPFIVAKNCKTSFQNTCSKFRFKKWKKNKTETQFYMIMLPMSSNVIRLIESKLACITKIMVYKFPGLSQC